MSTADDEAILDEHLVTAVTRVGNTICITVSGELDLIVEDELTELVLAVASMPDLNGLHFDLTDVTFIDSSGLRGLIQSSQFALERQLTFTVDVADDGPVARLLDVTGLREHFTQAALAMPA